MKSTIIFIYIPFSIQKLFILLSLYYVAETVYN